MKLIRKVITGGGVPAFFFFSWIIQLLWNSILVDQLQLLPIKVSYWQAAAVWFFFIILFAWTGIGVRQTSWAARKRNLDDLGDRIERKIRHKVYRWSHEKDTEDLDDLGDRIEQKIKQGFARWADVDEDTDWEEIGSRIERKIKRNVKDWLDEDE